MVIETVAEREKTSLAVLDALEELGFNSAYADDIAKFLEADGIEFEKTLWTIWRLIDENRLSLDDAGHLVIAQSEPGE